MTIAILMTSDSVVVPVRHSPGTIRKTVDAVVDQTYPGLVEMILVGHRDDPAWDPVRREVETGQVPIAEVSSPNAGFHRKAGMAAATGDVLCLPDCDTVPACNWVSISVALLGDRWRCVAGPMACTLCFSREVYEHGGFTAARGALQPAQVRQHQP